MTEPTVTINDLCAMVSERRDKAYRDKAHTGRRYMPRASDIGDCNREMVYAITNWEQRPPFDAHLLQRFQRGNDVESIVRRELAAIGVEIELAQLDFEIKDRDGTPLCTGHIDGRIRWHGLAAVAEIKSLNPNIWARVNSFEDWGRYKWARKYPRQLMLYCLQVGEPYGVWILDDCLGHVKLIPFCLYDHLDECEHLLKRLREVVDHKAIGELPDFIDDPETCRECWCYKSGICHPPLDFSRDGLKIIDDAELLEALETMDQVSEQASDYEAADKRVKDSFKARGAGKYLVGNFLVETSTAPRTGYEVPDDIRKQYAVIGSMTKTKWSRIKYAGDGSDKS